LSFSEIAYKHQILQIECQGEQLVSVEALPIPRAVALMRIGPLPLAELITRLSELPDLDLLADPERQPWLEARVILDEPQPDLRHQIETALQNKAVRLVRIAAEYAGRGRQEDDDGPLIELGQLSPVELFSRAWQDSYGSAADDQALSDFALLLQDVQLESEA
jgi:exonuclease SbcD